MLRLDDRYFNSPQAPAWDTPPGTSDYALPDNTLSAPGTPLGNFSLLDPDTCTCVITAPASHPYVLNQLTTVDPQGNTTQTCPCIMQRF